MTAAKTRAALAIAMAVGLGGMALSTGASAQFAPPPPGFAPPPPPRFAPPPPPPGYAPRYGAPRYGAPRYAAPRYGYRRGWSRGAAAAGVVGALALGALAAGAFAQPAPPVACHIERERYWNGQRWRWRDVEVCP
jgi:hypothetical protein